MDRHRQTAAYDRALMLAWTQAQIQLRHLSIGTEEAHLYQTLAGHLIYANPALRAPAKILLQDMGAQSALWPQGISGDRPILLVRIDETEDIEIVRQLLHAFEYWKTKRLVVDLVILNDRASSYVQDLQGAIEALVRKINVTRAPGVPGDAGQVFALRADLLSQETLRVLPAIARVVLFGRRGDLATQLARVRELAVVPSGQANEIIHAVPRSRVPSEIPRQLEFFNGFGGFSRTGANMSRCSKPTGQRQPHGSTSLPIPPSAFKALPMAAATPGLATAAKTRSPAGAMIPSATGPAKPSMCRTGMTGS